MQSHHNRAYIEAKSAQAATKYLSNKQSNRGCYMSDINNQNDSDSIITLVHSVMPSTLGKTYKNVDGQIIKNSVAHICTGEAEPLLVETADDLVDILEQVAESDDLCIIPGHFTGAILGDSFKIVTEKRLGEMASQPKRGLNTIDGIKYAARLKTGISSSKWLLIDCDDAPGMPGALKGMTIEERLTYLEPIVPGISKCERVELLSSSARVGKELAGIASHAWVQINRPDLIENLREHVRVKMVTEGLYFQSPRYSRSEPGTKVGSEPKTVVDLAVWIPGRIVFNSKPRLLAGMEDYKVFGADILIVNPDAGMLDIEWVQDLPNLDDIALYQHKTGSKLKYNSAGSRLKVEAGGLLKLDTEIESNGQVKNLQEWLLEIPNGGKLRCEAPFRESQSEAAAIFKGEDGGVSVYDIGNQTNYPLTVDQPEQEGNDQVSNTTPPIIELDGLLGAIADYAYDTSLYPDRALSCFTAIVTLGAMCGYDYVTPTGLKLSQFSAVAMPTGTGKESQRKVVIEALEAFDKRYLLMSFGASPQALQTSFINRAIDAVHRCAGDVSTVSDADMAKALEIIESNSCPYFSALCMEDELHRHLDAGKNHFKSDLRDLLLELYTSTDFIRPTTAMMNTYVPFRAPAFSFHGFTTPGELASALGNNSSSNGLVGRFMVFAKQQRPVKKYSVFYGDSKSSMKILLTTHPWAAGLATEQADCPIKVVWGEGALEHWINLDSTEIEPLKHEAVQHAEIGGRLGEQMLKIASVLAINDCKGSAPAVECRHLDKAWQYRRDLHFSFLDCMDTEGGIGRTDHAKLVEAVTQAIESFFNRNSKDAMPLSTLSKNCALYRNTPSYQKDSLHKELIGLGVCGAITPNGRGSSFMRLS